MMAQPKAIKQYTDNLKDECNSAYLYRTLAEIEKNPQIAEIYRRLAAAEEGHAKAWKQKLADEGILVDDYKPDWRTRLLAWLARRLGPAAVLSTLTTMEDDGTNGYLRTGEDGEMAATEQSHARLLRTIDQSGKGGMQGGVLAQLEGRHRTAGGNALRAAVLGANDGLVSNFSLVMGVAGANLSNSTILLTGFAGLLAGAISMALGEWISVQSSRELYEKQIRTERDEILSAPEDETEELALIYQARGVKEEIARSMAKQVMSNRDQAVETKVREELGINPEDLGGSAWEAAITSFLLFAVGAIIPVFPYIFLSGSSAIVVSTIFSAIGLFIIGASITLFTGRSVFFSGMRQMIFGLVAAAVTYAIGRLIGVNLGG